MRDLVFGLAVAAAIALASSVAADPARGPCHAGDASGFCPASAIEPGVLAEINFVRTHPRDYAERLRQGPMDADVADAIAFLESRAPAPPLHFTAELGASAAIHAADEGEHGAFEHDGSDGSTAADRMRREGVYAGILAEAMSAGEGDAGDVVRQLIVDAGVPSRGHRKDLLDPFLTRAGVACAPHPRYGVICVIDLASNPPPR